MFSKDDLMTQMQQLGIHPQGTVLIHSSMKQIGPVEGGAETVLDAWRTYMQDGLLVLPTHTWATINDKNPKFHVANSSVCVGILPELFRQQEGVIRSWHPTHSVAACGKDAASFTAGDEQWDTPCDRRSAWGKLLDREAQIMLVGVDLRRNTYIHGVEEWCDIPGRLTDTHQPLVTVLPDGREIQVPSRRHHGLSWSEHFWKVDEVLVEQGAMHIGRFGEAEVRVCDAKRVYEVLAEMLADNPDLFSDNEPLPKR